MSKGKKVVHAAGAVLWRLGSDGQTFEVAVIHRPRYDDWSLPKGKVDAGEAQPVTAAREILEETGHRVHLGRRLGVVDYPVDKRIKKVRYWAARSLGGEFIPNEEVDELVWLPATAAREKVVYQHDREILTQFAEHPADTETVLLVRHGTAGNKAKFSGDDTQRPLDKKGRTQAAALVGQLLAFGATDVYAADRLRCHQTVAPLAEKLDTAIRNEPTLTEEAYADNPDLGQDRVFEIAGASGTPVICSQGKVIPQLIARWCERDGAQPDESRNRKASTWVLSLAGGRLVAADHIDSPLSPPT